MGGSESRLVTSPFLSQRVKDLIQTTDAALNEFNRRRSYGIIDRTYAKRRMA